jgi:hypothetical protein
MQQIKTNLDIEKIGTELVLKYEKEQQRNMLKNKTKGCGWDICTGNEKEIRYIEIKTTRSKKLTGRWLEHKGYDQFLNNPNFWIYGVTEIKEDGSGKVKTYSPKNIIVTEDIKYVLKLD